MLRGADVGLHDGNGLRSFTTRDPLPRCLVALPGTAGPCHSIGLEVVIELDSAKPLFDRQIFLDTFVV